MALGFALGVGLWAAWLSWGGPATGPPALATIYRNARPGVRFVGDAACTRCHSEIAADYRQHPMGRSMIPIAEAPAELRGEESPRELFEAGGFHYSLERRDGRTIHRETRRDAQGRVIGQVEGEVRYVLGSGTRGQAFLIQRDDFLFQSPITWYSQEKRWDLAPGYETRDDRFGREIVPECLTCHVNRVEHVAGTEGRYRPPIFRGHAIGCERCHGPGELHVREPLDAAGAGPSIVNPRDLTPALREDVCRQCHLVGKEMVARYGREVGDYRPGLPLREFRTVFVQPGESGEHANADHVEQMSQSRCFRESRGALGCISCHNPHELPPQAEKAAYYRDRCLSCHADRGCSLPVDERRARGTEDDCIACHMPRAPTSDIPHVATTLHFIPRERDLGLAKANSRPRTPPDETSLVPFDRDQMSPEELEATGRDLGVALRFESRSEAALAVPLLETALRKHPDDVPARESLGMALWRLGRSEEGLSALEAVLSSEPGRVLSLDVAARVVSRLGRVDPAIAAWRRAIAVDPWRSAFHAELANELNLAGRWAEASAAARQALRLNPANHNARFALILSSFRMGARREAQAQFQTLLGFDPPGRDNLVRWFSTLR